jgi:hypothetical protein
MEAIYLLVGIIVLVMYVITFNNISSIAKSSRNTEAILRRMLQNTEPKKEETAANPDQFAKYKTKL